LREKQMKSANARKRSVGGRRRRASNERQSSAGSRSRSANGKSRSGSGSWKRRRVIEKSERPRRGWKRKLDESGQEAMLGSRDSISPSTKQSKEARPVVDGTARAIPKLQPSENGSESWNDSLRRPRSASASTSWSARSVCGMMSDVKHGQGQRAGHETDLEAGLAHHPALLLRQIAPLPGRSKTSVTTYASNGLMCKLRSLSLSPKRCLRCHRVARPDALFLNPRLRGLSQIRRRMRNPIGQIDS
jgi:hypothetical protein